MDPAVTLAAALKGAAASRAAYNDWVKNGGFQATVKTQVHTDQWMCGIRSLSVKFVGTKYAHGTHPATGVRLRLPISALEVE